MQDSFDFMTKISATVLHPVVFGCQCTHGNESKMHSHLGKSFAGDYAINKNCHTCFGQHITWVTDCFAIKYILLYNCCNPSILHLKMQFMCWDMDIEHQNDQTQTIGHGSDPTCALTFCSMITLGRSMHYSSTVHLLPSFHTKTGEHVLFLPTAASTGVACHGPKSCTAISCDHYCRFTHWPGLRPSASIKLLHLFWDLH
jgi:hypothetical protein